MNNTLSDSLKNDVLDIGGAVLAPSMIYDFRTMSEADVLAQLNTQHIWRRATVTNGEAQAYPDPVILPDDLKCMQLSDEGLKIIARRLPEDIEADVQAVLATHRAPEPGEIVPEPIQPTELQKQFLMVPEEHRTHWGRHIADDELPNAQVQPYISTLLSTRNYDADGVNKGFDFKYGYQEVCAKCPAKLGAWPAFWDYPSWNRTPDGTQWPLSEGDTMEVMAKLEDAIRGMYSINVHTRQSVGHEGTMTDMNKAGVLANVETGKDLTADYHLFGQNRTPEKIEFYVDRQLVASMPMPSDMDEHPRFMILNLAVGGNPSWREQPDLDDYEPMEMDVKWMGAWEPVVPYPSKDEPAPNQPAAVATPAGGALSNVQKAVAVTKLANVAIEGSQFSDAEREYLIDLINSAADDLS